MAIPKCSHAYLISMQHNLGVGFWHHVKLLNIHEDWVYNLQPLSSLVPFTFHTRVWISMGWSCIHDDRLAHSLLSFDAFLIFACAPNCCHVALIYSSDKEFRACNSGSTKLLNWERDGHLCNIHICLLFFSPLLLPPCFAPMNDMDFFHVEAM